MTRVLALVLFVAPQAVQAQSISYSVGPSGTAVCTAQGACTCPATACSGTTCPVVGTIACGGGQITVGTGVTLRVSPWGPTGATNDGVLSLSAASITIDAGAIIDANGSGFSGSAAPGSGACDANAEGVAGNGFGPGFGKGGRCYQDAGGGGGYGGKGGNGTRDSGCANVDGPGGDPYDNDVNSVERGSGAGAAGSGDGDNGGTGPAGGGAVFLNAPTIAVYGTIRARGGNGANVGNDAQGGGSGGGVMLTASSFIDCGTTGSISVAGGDGASVDDKGGAGGGGRIKLFSTTIIGTCSFDVAGGAGGCSAGAGTIGGMVAPPLLTFTAPTGALFNTPVGSATFPVSGTAVAQAGASLPSGMAITFTSGSVTTAPFAGVLGSSGQWSIGNANYVPPAEGLVTITATTVDSNGRVASLTRTYTYDATAPSGSMNIVSANPAPTGPVSLSGTFTDTSTVTVTGEACASDCASSCSPITVTRAGNSFASTIPVASSGNYCARVVLTDALNQATTLTRPFTVDKDAPSVAIASTLSVERTPRQVCVSITDALTAVTPTASWTVNGIPQVLDALIVSATCPGGNYLIDLPASASGAAVLTVTATDAANNVASANVSFDVDNNAPTISLDTRPTLRKDADVSGTVSDAYATTVTTSYTLGCTGAAIPAPPQTVGAPSGGFSAVAALPSDGHYCVSITATDVAGNRSTETQEFDLDTVGPTLSLWTPAQPTNAERPPVTGAAFDSSGLVSATLNVMPADAGGNCQASLLNTIDVLAQANGFTLDPWQDGAVADGKYCITLSATDAAGNASTRTLVIEKSASAATLIVDVSPSPNVDPRPTATGFGPSGSVHVVFAEATNTGGCSATAAGEGDATVAKDGTFSFQAPTPLTHALACQEFCATATAAGVTATTRFNHCSTATTGNSPMTVTVAPATADAAIQVSGTAPSLATQVDVHVYAVDSTGHCTLVEVGGGQTTRQNQGTAQSYTGNTGTALPAGTYCVQSVALQGTSTLAVAQTRVTVAPVTPPAPTGTTGATGTTGTSGNTMQPSGPSGNTAASGDTGEGGLIAGSGTDGNSSEDPTVSDADALTPEQFRVMGTGCNCRNSSPDAALFFAALLIALRYLPKRRLR